MHNHQEINLSTLYGKFQSPFYVYAPRWIDSSAGIKALHYLCHSLNKSGSIAYLVLTESPVGNLPRINPRLQTPILTQEVADAHFKSGLTPVVIYSETVPGNPLKAPMVVRYLMNYVGVLGGPLIFPKNEYIIAFSEKIAEHYSQTTKLEKPDVLFLPPIDPREFTNTAVKEDFQIVYAGKYRSFVGKPPSVGKEPSIEIYRDGPNMQSRDEVKALLRKAKIVYLFENSSIATEAILSGTPVYFVPNPFLGEIIASVELGNGGIADSDDEKSIEYARSTIEKANLRYLQKISDYYKSLTSFVSKSTKEVSTVSYLVCIEVPEHRYLLNAHRLKMARQIAQNKGLRVLARVSMHFILRRLTSRHWRERKRVWSY